MIDLHLHTTASDGLCSPQELVQRAAAAGLSRIAVTDHDTSAALGEAAAHCARSGIAFVPGIEITSILEGADVHMLGYFLDPENATLASFLARQRENRLERIRKVAERLSTLGAPIDVTPLLEAGTRQDGRSIGRPQIARALIAAGHAVDVSDAFERWLGHGRPAFVPRAGAHPGEVIEIIHGAGGLASLAHPGLTGIDEHIAALRDAGLDAIEAYHSEHDPETQERYVATAADLGLLVTGGSDYHGDPAHGVSPGSVTLPLSDWERLSAWQPRC